MNAAPLFCDARPYAHSYAFLCAVKYPVAKLLTLALSGVLTLRFAFDVSASNISPLVTPR
jgi:hypothetical protein